MSYSPRTEPPEPPLFLEELALQDQLERRFGRDPIARVPLPTCIRDNLNPRFVLRAYQVYALQLYLTYWRCGLAPALSAAGAGDPLGASSRHVLFQMATGSGKTLIMASLLLHLYEQGYRNFLFFVHSTDILEQTKGLFLSAGSDKYLFANKLTMAGRPVELRAIQTLPPSAASASASAASDVSAEPANLLFCTVQELHNIVSVSRENRITLDDFENHKWAVFSDEAHHTNTETKRGTARSPHRGNLSWEHTVQKITTHPETLLFEFTATMLLNNPELLEKYRPKLIFDYALAQFCKARFSKNIRVLQWDSPPLERALLAVLLSQYRKKLFETQGLSVKPVLLFKSETIRESQQFYALFSERLRKVTSDELSRLRAMTYEAPTTDPILAPMFRFFEEHQIDFDNLALELREDFAESRWLLIHSQAESVEKRRALKNLEHPTNPYRVIVAVDKLSEGWDVLNLFDIVRVSLGGSSRWAQNKSQKITTREAQLIGRGARYYPFAFTEEQDPFRRKFDADPENELRLCETLYYHSPRDSAYIAALSDAMKGLGLVEFPAPVPEKMTLKSDFKKRAFYQNGVLFFNGAVARPLQEKHAFYRDLIGSFHLDIPVLTYAGRTDDLLGQTKTLQITRAEKALSDFSDAVVHKALCRNVFYHFSSLRRYLPCLTSTREFIKSPTYLGKVKVRLTGTQERLQNLTPDEELYAVECYLNRLEQAFTRHALLRQGTAVFSPRHVRDIFHDKSMPAPSPLPPPPGACWDKAHTWYVFNEGPHVGRLSAVEQAFLKYFEAQAPELQRKYAEVYVIRNEGFFKLYPFEDGRVFEPDFLLYLRQEHNQTSTHYQVFIEAKGEHLIGTEKWKEDFLLSIESRARTQPGTQSGTEPRQPHYVILGLPFYREHQNRPIGAFCEIFEKRFLRGSRPPDPVPVPAPASAVLPS